MKTDHYTYRVTWSTEDGEYAGLCTEFPSLSWMAASPDLAFSGIRELVSEVIFDMLTANEKVPEPLAEPRYSGEFMVPVPPRLTEPWRSMR